MKDHFKFWTQTLIIPITLAIIGYVLNGSLQKQQQNLEKIKFTDQILNEAFDSENPDKAFALLLLLPKISNDSMFINTIKKRVEAHALFVAKNAARNGNDSIYSIISNSAREYQGQGISVADSLIQNATTNKAEQAQALEQKGLTLLQSGNLKLAQESFEKADKVYPGFHSNYEISNLIKTKISTNNNPDSVKVKNEIIRTIKKDYSWKMNVSSLKN